VKRPKDKKSKLMMIKCGRMAKAALPFHLFSGGSMDFRPVVVNATNLEEAWVRLMYNAIDRGRPYLVTEGSRAGQHRMTMDVAIANIKHPELRPLYPLGKAGQVVPIDEVAIKKYFENYVYSDSPPKPNEHYNYSDYIYPLANAIMDYYAKKGFGNAHCTIRVGQPSCFLDYNDPYKDETERKTTPCLLAIDTRIIENNLLFYVYYRSWDLFSGYPLNNAGFQELKELMCAYIAGHTDVELEPGPTVTVCKDLHLYEEDIPAAAGWTGQDVAQLVDHLRSKRNITPNG
jgi:thymidylate synthase